MEPESKDPNIAVLKKFVALERQKAALKETLARVEAQINDLKEIATDIMVDSGITNMKIDGRTIYIAHEIWAKRVGSIEEAEEALKKAGLEIFLSKGFNHQSLSAFVREKINNKEPLPESFHGIIEANHVDRIKTTKG